MANFTNDTTTWTTLGSSILSNGRYEDDTKKSITNLIDAFEVE